MREQSNGDEDIDPHYAQMLKVSNDLYDHNHCLTNPRFQYPDAPNSWYCATFVVSFAVGLVVIYMSDSTLPWWGFVIAVMLAILCIVFFGALFAITGLVLSFREFFILINVAQAS